MKKILSLLAVFVLVLSLAACTKPLPEPSGGGNSSPISTGGNESTPPPPVGGGNTYEDNATQIGSNTTYYNDYLGLSYTVKSGWWCYDLDTDNFAGSAGQTGYNNLYIASGTSGFWNAGYEEIFLAHFGNMQYSNNNQHVSIELYALKIEGANTLNAFANCLIEYNEAPYTDGRPGDDLVETYTATIDGRQFMACVFLKENGEYDYYYTLYITEMKDGFYLVIQGDYWPENTDGEDEVVGILNDCLQFN